MCENSNTIPIDSNGNHELLVADLHILNQLRTPDTFIADVK